MGGQQACEPVKQQLLCGFEFLGGKFVGGAQIELSACAMGKRPDLEIILTFLGS